MSARPATAESGNELVIPLPKQARSGTMPYCSNPKNVPVRPNPACTSSQTSSACCWSHQPRSRCMNSVGAKGGVGALVSLENYAGDRTEVDTLVAQALLEGIKRGVGLAVAVGECDLHETRVEVHDPVLERRDAAGLLGAESSPVKGVAERDDRDLLRSGVLDAVDAAQLHGAFDGLRSGGQQKDFSSKVRVEPRPVSQRDCGGRRSGSSSW